MEQLVLQVEIRKQGTKGELNAMRADKKIPAVIYGGDKPPMPVLVAAKEFTRIQTAHRANAILTLKHPEGSDTVIMKAFQRHPVGHHFTHVDFQRISLKKEIEVRVPIRTLGEPPGVKASGGLLEHILREVEVKCLPTAIPEAIELDVSKLDIGDTLHVRDIKPIPGVNILTDPEAVLVSVLAPKAEEVAPAAVPAEGAAEPEVIAKGKKEEEGAAAEAGKGEKVEKGKEAPKKEPAK